MPDDTVLLRINHEIGWNCDGRCQYCYRFFACPRPEKEEVFYKNSRFSQIARRTKNIRHKVAVMAGKGGVGKTTVTASLAMQLALQGHAVGILDVDFAGASIANFLRLPRTRLRLGEDGILPVIGPHGLKVASNSFFIDAEKAVTDFDDRKQEMIGEFLADMDFGHLDYLLIDMPPGTGIEVINVLKLVPSIDGVVFVTIPSEVAQEVVLRAVGQCRQAGARLLGIVENMSTFECPRCGHESQTLAAGGAARLSAACGLPVLASIPAELSVSQGVDEKGVSFLEIEPPGLAAQAYRELAQRVESLVGPGPDLSCQGLRPLGSEVRRESSREGLPEAAGDRRETARAYQDGAGAIGPESLPRRAPISNPEHPGEPLEILDINHGFACNHRCLDCATYFACSYPAKDRLVGPLVERIRRRLAAVRHKVAVLGGKGGVGKSTVAANLGVALSRLGKSCAVLDADMHGPSIPKLLGVSGERLHLDHSGVRPVKSPWGPQVISLAFLTDETEAVTWFHELKRSALEQFLAMVEFGTLDYLLIDLPAGTGSETVACLRALPDLDGGVVVTSPSYLAQAIGLKAIDLLRTAGVPVLGVVENMSEVICPACGATYPIFTTEETSLAARAGVPCLAAIPMEEGIARASDEGTPVAAYTATSAGRVFSSLAERLISAIS